MRLIALVMMAAAAAGASGAEIGEARRNAILVSLSKRTADAQMPGALAYALPYEGTHIVVFYDRVRSTAERTSEFRLLAYVMVHEITDIL